MASFVSKILNLPYYIIAGSIIKNDLASGCWEMEKKFKTVAVGGTFDRLHAGHMHLLCKAFCVGENVLIGLTTDEMLARNPKNHPVEPYSIRKNNLLKYLSNIGVANRVKIIQLNDFYGPALTDPEIEALIVSYETLQRGKEINRLRVEKGLRPLTLIVVDILKAEDGLPITSTRIRKGEIDEEGRLIHFE
jgi:pantetheine-phosphate adenylyltransferase